MLEVREKRRPVNVIAESNDNGQDSVREERGGRGLTKGDARNASSYFHSDFVKVVQVRRGWKRTAANPIGEQDDVGRRPGECLCAFHLAEYRLPRCCRSCPAVAPRPMRSQ